MLVFACVRTHEPYLVDGESNEKSDSTESCGETRSTVNQKTSQHKPFRVLC